MTDPDNESRAYCTDCWDRWNNPEAYQPEPERELVAIPIEPDPGPAMAIGIDVATEHLASAVEELSVALASDDSLGEASSMERQAFAKYLTVAKIKLDTAIAVVRAQEPRGLRRPIEDPEREPATRMGGTDQPS